ncbi:MAG: tyrosine-type recombinase/integrase [Phycisphaeraceae bacterium JB051]
MAKATKDSLTYRKNKGYTRDLGWKLNKDKRRIQPRFLLGHDKHTAQLANARLESLWQTITQEAEEQNKQHWDGPTVDPLWDNVTLTIANAIRKGQATVTVPAPSSQSQGSADDDAYATYIHSLQQTYAGIIAFAPEDPDALKRGQESHLHFAEHRARQARNNAAIANTPIPDTGVNQSLYQAFEAYAQYAAQNRKGGANEPKDARTLTAAIKDATLDQFGYDAIEQIGNYWRSRPISKSHGSNGRKMAVNTVNNRLKTTRRFIRWMHRSDAWHWRAPEDWEEALRFNENRLLDEHEKLKLAEGPKTWTDEELVTLYSYATDRERCLLLMGLNLGYAQSEAISFRKQDVLLDENPPRIKRVRRKSGKMFQAAIWPQTIAALNWLANERQRVEPANNDWILLTERGKRPDRQHLANTWNKLLDRIQQDHKAFRRLSFKHLRKTAYQLVLEEGGSQEVAGTFEGRSQLSSDEHADVYGRRLYEKVFEANQKVHEQLAPMFASAPDAFTQPRTKGGPNLSKGKIDQIKRLKTEGVKPAEIARITGVSTTTVYRWI